MGSHGTYWRTDSELRFLKYLGTGKWVKQPRTCGLNRLQLLENYQVAALNRQDWGEIDIGKVMNYVAQEIAFYREKTN